MTTDELWFTVFCCDTEGCLQTTSRPGPGWWVHRQPGRRPKYWCPTHGREQA